MPARTEREKMLAGESYSLFDPDLAAERDTATGLLRRFNLAEAPSERHRILQELLGHIGRDSIIQPPFYCSYGRNTRIGDHVYLNWSCIIIDNNEVRVGDHVMVGPFVQLYTADHPLQAEPRIRGLEVAKPIVIEDNVWLGGGAILLPGVRIGRNAVVGAGAVVSRSVPADTVVAGCPTRVIAEIQRRSARARREGAAEHRRVFGVVAVDRAISGVGDDPMSRGGQPVDRGPLADR